MGRRGNRNADGQRGQGAGRGPGRMGGNRAAGPGGDCVCPNCGHRELHAIGTPCYEMRCPKCGTTMARGN